MSLSLGQIDTPLGPLLLATDTDGRLHACEYADIAARMDRLLRRRGAPDLAPGPVPPRLAAAFAAYFSGQPEALAAIPVCLGGSAFQAAVWAALRQIPAGRTEAYGALAARIGRPGAARAVGLANHDNPCQIVVPCHRVVGASGALTGYAGGMERKRWLLRHEAGAAPLPGF